MGKAWWSLAPMLLGLALYGLSPLLMGALPLGMDLYAYGGWTTVAMATTALSAAFARRPAWRASLSVAAVASVLSAVLFPCFLIAIEGPDRTTMLPSSIMRTMVPMYTRTLRTQEADLALLSRGERAASEGRPLGAPEGGFLVPVDLGSFNHYASSFRYESVSDAPSAAVWSAALASGRAKAAESRAFLELRSSARPALWVYAGLSGIGRALALAVVANLLALVSRAVFGEPR